VAKSKSKRSTPKRSTGRSRKAAGSSPARRKTKPAATKATPQPDVAPPATAECDQPARDDKAAYLETVIATGEAARLDRDGKLPAGATHKIAEDDAGNVKVVRRRFSIS
jgi:hypothetical protein